MYIKTNNQVYRLNHCKKYCIYNTFLDFVSRGNYQFNGGIKNYCLVSVNYCRVSPTSPPQVVVDTVFIPSATKGRKQG